MNSLNVKSLNECFNVDGPDWIEDDINSYTHTHTLPPVNNGEPPWNKGKTGLYKHSEETKIKLSELVKGKNNPNYGKPSWNKGNPAWNRGIPQTEKVKEKLSKANKNNNIKYHYTIYSIKENKTYETNSLKAFCKEYSLDRRPLSKTFTGERKQHMGFKIILKEPLQDAWVPV